MSQYQIGIVVGSLREGSYNKMLADGLVRLAPKDFSCKLIAIDDLPLYNQDHDASPAASVKRLKSEIAGSDGLIFVTPEYNRSIPGVLKNALDHASRPYGQNAWAKKPSGIIGISIGTIGTAMAQQHLRNILSYLDVPTLSQPEAYIQMKEGFFDEKGNIGPASKEFLQKWMNDYAQWVKSHSVKI